MKSRKRVVCDSDEEPNQLAKDTGPSSETITGESNKPSNSKNDKKPLENAKRKKTEKEGNFEEEERVPKKKIVLSTDSIKVDYKNKEEVIDEILCRWWYALPLWPPKDYDYSKGLSERKLRKVSPENWSVEPNVDSKGNRKAIEIEGYPGLFQDIEQKIYDLRPRATCPCRLNFEKKPLEELHGILKKGYVEQLKQLKAVLNPSSHYKTVMLDVARRLSKLGKALS